MKSTVLRLGTLFAGTFLALLPTLSSAASVTMFSDNFESYTPVALGPTAFGGYGALYPAGGWQVQGGGGTAAGPTVTAGIDGNGAGFSQGFFSTWDNTGAAGTYVYSQETIYGAVNSLGGFEPASHVSLSMDLYINGSEGANNPIQVVLQNNGVDMTYTPNLVNGQYTHVAFTLDQTAGTNAMGFASSLSSNLRFQFGAYGFGFDSGNVFEADNILITGVPEPGTLALLGLGAAALMVFRRRN